MKEEWFRSVMVSGVNVLLEIQRWLNWLALRGQAKATRKIVFCTKRRMELSLVVLRNDSTLSRSQPGKLCVLLGLRLLTPSNMALIWASSAKLYSGKYPVKMGPKAALYPFRVL